MATVEECRHALDSFAEQLRSNREQVKGKANFDRRLACDITDLEVAFNGRFREGDLVDITEGDNPEAEIRMTVDSDDLVSMINGDLEFGKAFAAGRVKLKASVLDMLKLKSLL